jgi:hypothetical protein
VAQWFAVEMRKKFVTNFVIDASPRNAGGKKQKKSFLENEKAKINNFTIEPANQPSAIVLQVPTSFGSRSCDQVMWFLPRIMTPR